MQKVLKRDLQPVLERYALQFPVVAILGPRQSGKTYLAQHAFPGYRYMNLEDLDVRRIAASDPRLFLESLQHEQGVIIDEFQRVPELLSYMQGFVDRAYRPGFYILTSSQNFLTNAAISQSLAGRVGILTLLPLAQHELQENGVLPDTLSKQLSLRDHIHVYTRSTLSPKISIHPIFKPI